MNSGRIHQQSLFKLQLNKQYYLELAGVSFLNLKDTQGNSLTLYESDYTKLSAYLKDKHLDHFPDLPVTDKLKHLEKAHVRITRYFSTDNLEKYELDAESYKENNLSTLASKNGTALLSDGEQNCVVVYKDRIYIHPKVRCASGSIDHEVLEDAESKSTTQQGIIGVSHSSLCHGHQVSFAGSIVRDKNLGWTLDNTSGHYITRAHQIKALLIALKDKGIDLAKLTVKLWIINEPRVIPPILRESDYHIIVENAAAYLDRMQDSQLRYTISK